MPTISWSASETERIEPFKTCPTAFDSCQLRLSSSEEFDENKLIAFESEEDWLSTRPEIYFNINQPLVAKETGIPENELSVGIVIRDRMLNKFHLVNQWKIAEVPLTPISLVDVLPLFSKSIRLDICVYLYPSISKNRGDKIASYVGEILGRKIFKVRVVTQKSKFPKRWATPDEFEEKELPRNTVFWIDWKVHDLNRHPQEAFVVWLNDEYKNQINSFQIGGISGTLLQRTLSASILTELATAVLASDQEPTEPEGIIMIIEGELMDVSNKSLGEMRQMFKDRHDAHSLTRAWVHEKLGVNQLLGELTFKGGRT